jgi:hypothetical protein
MRPSSENKLTIPRLLLIAAILVSWFFSSFRRHDDGSCIKETKDVVDTSENGDGRKGRGKRKKGGKSVKEEEEYPFSLLSLGPYWLTCRVSVATDKTCCN